MRQLTFAIALTLLVCATAGAQDQPEARPNSGQGSGYYMDREAAARAAIQQRAAWKAAQRQARLEMYRWYGYSPLRPPVDPIMGSMGSSIRWMGPIVYYRFPGTFLRRTAPIPQ